MKNRKKKKEMMRFDEEKEQIKHVEVVILQH